MRSSIPQQEPPVITPLIYTPQASIAPEHLDEHRRWYTTTHAPRLMGLGFYSCRMFDGPGTRWCNLYEIPNTEIFATNGYKAIGESDVFMKLNLSRFIDLNVTTYAQELVLGADGESLRDVPSLSGSVLSFIRFDWSGADQDLRQWLREALLREAGGAGPVRTVRLLRRESEHPQLKTNYPRWCATVEWRKPIAPTQPVLDRAAAQLGSQAARLSQESFTKRFGLVREDCFPP
jgi:hypothetical protein